MMRRRVGRPGLIGAMARTAVITGTATAVSGNVQRRQMARAQEEAAERAAAMAPVPPAPSSAGVGGSGDQLLDQLARLADLRSSGVLDESEFAAAKARLLGS